jgi:Na+-driven multidrug efflux pump
MVSLSMSIFFIMQKKSYLHIHISSFKPSSSIVKNIFEVGMPATLMMLLVSLYIVFINKFMAFFGTDYVASFGAATRLESIATMPVMAVSLALITIVGMFYGAKKYHLLKETIDYAWKISMIYTCTIGLIFFIFPRFFLRIFTDDPALIEIGVQYMRINVFTFPLMTTGMMMSRVMQGMGSGFPGLLVNLIRIVFVAVPLAYVFVYVFSLGFIWIAIAMVIGSIASSIVARLFVNHKIKELMRDNIKE